jgi:hypothetical protein
MEEPMGSHIMIISFSLQYAICQCDKETAADKLHCRGRIDTKILGFLIYDPDPTPIATYHRPSCAM